MSTTTNILLSKLYWLGGRNVRGEYLSNPGQIEPELFAQPVPTRYQMFFAIWVNWFLDMSSKMWMIMLHWMTSLRGHCSVWGALMQMFFSEIVSHSTVFSPWKLVFFNILPVANKSLDKTKTRNVLVCLSLLSDSLSPKFFHF